jgi:hypothetical protein
LSWDVHLQKFDRQAEATFDLGVARRVLGRTSGFREVEPGVGEVEDDGYAEVYYGVEPSSDMMVAARSSSSGVIRLICELAAELRMAVFFPTETDWGVAALGVSQVDDLPDSSWEGWELGLRRRLSAMFALTQPWAQRLRSAGCSGTRSSSCFMGCAVSVMPARIASHLFARSAAMIPSNPTLLHSALTPISLARPPPMPMSEPTGFEPCNDSSGG